jgi:hypothetical protein
VTNPNPFAPNVPAQPQQQGGNPFAQPQQQPQAPAQQPPAGNPFAAPAPQQPAPNGYYAQPAPQQPQAYPQQQPYQPHPAPQGPYGQTATQQQAAPPALDPNALSAAAPPPPSGDAKGAKLPDMYGRLVVIFPLSFEQRPKNPGFITPQDRANGNLMQDQITATVVVIDDGRGGYSPISWGGDPMRNIPPTDTVALPYVRRAMWISQSKLIAQLRPYLPQTPGAAPGMAVGRVLKAGNEANSPWYLSTATDDEVAHARLYLNLVAQGQVPHPLAPAAA